MQNTVADRLYEKFYSGPVSGSPEASSHWKDFSQRSEVIRDTDGAIQTLKGYGFGGNDDTRPVARLMAGVGNALAVSTLHYAGLKNYLPEAKQIVASMGLYFSQDAFRQACTCFFLRQQLKERKVPVNKILIIGDGHGILAALLHKTYPEATVVLTDLGRTLFFQSYYLGKSFPLERHTLCSGGKQLPDQGFLYCAAEELNFFPEASIDLAINIASMQEMTMPTISRYFTLLRSHDTSVFYCCNRLEKILPGGEAIRFMDYPWHRTDLHWVDEACPWHRFFAGRSNAKHVKLFGVLPVPLLHEYDGVHWHRLTKLSPYKPVQ